MSPLQLPAPPQPVTTRGEQWGKRQDWVAAGLGLKRTWHTRTAWSILARSEDGLAARRHGGANGFWSGLAKKGEEYTARLNRPPKRLRRVLLTGVKCWTWRYMEHPRVVQQKTVGGLLRGGEGERQQVILLFRRGRWGGGGGVRGWAGVCWFLWIARVF